MRYFGFLSFGYYLNGDRRGIIAVEPLRQVVDLPVAADELSVNDVFFHVHRFAVQAAASMPLLFVITLRTKTIEVDTGIIDMRYENLPYLAEEATALDLIANGRIVLGVSCGVPEIANKEWEPLGYRSKE